MPATIHQMDEARDRKLLTEHVAAIRSLGKKTVENIIKIGRRLTVVRHGIDGEKPLLTHGEWLPWLAREFGWKERTARNFISVYEASKSAKFADLSLPVSSLYLLAAPSTPSEARGEIIERAKAGEKPSVAEVERVIEEHKDHAQDRKRPAKKAKAKTERPAGAIAEASAEDDEQPVRRMTKLDRELALGAISQNDRLRRQNAEAQLALEKARIRIAELEAENAEARSEGNNADPEQSADRRRAEYAELAGGADPERVAEAPRREARTEPTKPDSRPANYWINKLLTFHCDFSNELREWLSNAQLIEAVDEFHEGDREALIHRFQSCSSDLVLMSQQVRDKR